VEWRLEDEMLVPVALSITETVRNINEHILRPDIEIFKLNERKAVFRVECPHITKKSFVVKVFFLNRLEHGLQYYRYGLDEVANLIKAADKGINTPKVYGYGHINNALGLVKASVIILEDLRGLSSLDKIMNKKREDERSDVFMRTIPLFVSLYRASCNHIDVNSGAVMLCEQNLNSLVYLLDFQHAKFYKEPSAEILMFEAGYFAKSCRRWISTETINEWLSALLDNIGISSAHDRGKMIKQFNYYFQTELSRKRRKTLIRLNLNTVWRKIKMWSDY
jgi:tRNA A-37 threonylcarbamoyl transferase component Bud32